MGKIMEDIVQNLSGTAVKYAKTFNKEFTFSEDDIRDLEEILDFYSNDLKGNLFKNIFRKINKTMPNDKQIYSMSMIWGSYLGQLLRKHINPKLDWVEEDVFGEGKFLHLKEGDNRIFPIDKVYKRLVNGEEDNITSFYEVLKRDF